MKAESVVLKFVDAINDADLERLVSLLTDRHVFIDSDGSEIVGAEPVLEAWSRFFSMVADYRVRVQETFHSGSTVVLIGSASGTPRLDGVPEPERRWSVPAAWRAVVDGDRLARWQVFVNPEPILEAAGLG